jgi:pyruvate ferredoxin oxidoreductase beta subunit
MVQNKELIKIWEKGTKRFTPGHRTCAGCFIPTIVRTVLGSIDEKVIVGNATGCAEVTSTLWPHTSWNLPYIHNAFENAAATLSGVESVYKVLKRKGQIKEKIKFVVFAGDGGTVDIGLQSLSGMLERGHNIMYILYNNEGYQNTGNQRSSATPYDAATTTTPAGLESFGKKMPRKDIMKIVAAHGIEYLAQANPYYLDDFIMKVKKASKVEGPSFLNVLMPCTFGWKFPTDMTPQIAELATETNFWPLYEIQNTDTDEKWKMNYTPKKKLPISDFLKHQGRFKHLFKPKLQTAELTKIQTQIDNELKRIKNKC